MILDDVMRDFQKQSNLYVFSRLRGHLFLWSGYRLPCCRGGTNGSQNSRVLLFCDALQDVHGHGWGQYDRGPREQGVSSSYLLHETILGEETHNTSNNTFGLT